MEAVRVPVDAAVVTGLALVDAVSTPWVARWLGMGGLYYGWPVVVSAIAVLTWWNPLLNGGAKPRARWVVAGALLVAVTATNAMVAWCAR